MNKSKWLLVSLVLVMVFVLAACGGKKDNNASSSPSASAPTASASASSSEEASAEEEYLPEEGAKLVVWYSASEKALVDEAAKLFKEKYGIDIEYQDVGPDKSIEKMITDGPAGVGADVFLAVHDRLGSAVQAGVVLPNDLHAEESIANNSEKSVEALSIDGQLYGYPMSVETTAVFYNKDLFADTNGEAPKDWNGVIEFAKKFNDTKAQKYAYMWEVGNGYWSWGFFGGYGGYVFGKDGTDPSDVGLNSPGSVEAAKFFSSLKEILPIKAADIKADIKTSLFNEGKLAMNVSGPWQVGEFKKSVKNLGVMEYPILPNGKPMMPFSGVKGFLVNANTKYPIASKLFAQLVSSEALQAKNFELFGSLPSNKNVAASPAVSGDAFASVFLKQFDNSTPMPKIAEMAGFWGTHEAALSSLWNDGADAQKTMDDWAKKVKDSNSAAK
ncbi:sugar ABC transporter substrate-binding protein [Cohnella mopanensis]|uniref:sugar ABC transporter substrate-binding protein n=1 Tax=Cohnella mopanensis TaxID=2911966 RepID=UPI001EF87108|nr:maltose ABC transporter substrate-binding protein [Cohnella mopanensis]